MKNKKTKIQIKLKPNSQQRHTKLIAEYAIIFLFFLHSHKTAHIYKTNCHTITTLCFVLCIKKSKKYHAKLRKLKNTKKIQKTKKVFKRKGFTNTLGLHLAFINVNHVYCRFIYLYTIDYNVSLYHCGGQMTHKSVQNCCACN